MAMMDPFDAPEHIQEKPGKSVYFSFGVFVGLAIGFLFALATSSVCSLH